MSASNEPGSGVPEWVVSVLLLLAALGLTGSAVAGWGWWQAAQRAPSIAELSAEDRQRLIGELRSVSPGEHVWSYYEPRIGYTLKPETELTVWQDTFVANELGYRSGPVEKAPGTFRVLLVGDSWTYGMGVSGAESFPKVFERLARQHAGLGQEIEAWTLALPGYNTFNQLSAMWFFWDRLQADAVIFCPTDNDHHSTATILPNGSPWRGGLLQDQFGEPHSVTYRGSKLESYRFTERWRQAFDALADSVARLESLGVPTAMFFVARWEEPRVNYWLEQSAIEAPYTVLPASYTLGRWRNPMPLGHGTVEANRLYGEIVYRLAAEAWGWPSLPAAATDPETPEFPVHLRPPEGPWAERYAVQVRRSTAKQIATSYRPGLESHAQVAGQLGLRDGAMGQATTILVRRASQSRQLAVRIRRLQAAAGLYPLRLTVSIPSAADPQRRAFEVPASPSQSAGDEPLEFVLDLPRDVPPGAALDVTLESDRVVMAPDLLTARSLYVESIEQR